MSESSQAGKGDDPRNIGPAFREHFPEVDWRDKRPQRTCANCSTPIKTSGYAIVGSHYYCDSACARGVVKWRNPSQPTWPRPLRDGEPCDHPGCASHVTHPCEQCGRIAAQGSISVYKGPTIDVMRNENEETLGVFMRAINLIDENRRNDSTP